MYLAHADQKLVRGHGEDGEAAVKIAADSACAFFRLPDVG